MRSRQQVSPGRKVRIKEASAAIHCTARKREAKPKTTHIARTFARSILQLSRQPALSSACEYLFFKGVFFFSVSTYFFKLQILTFTLGGCLPSLPLFRLFIFLLRCCSGACARPPEHSLLRVWVGRTYFRLSLPSQETIPRAQSLSPALITCHVPTNAHNVLSGNRAQSTKGNLLSLTQQIEKKGKNVNQIRQRRRSKY